MAEKDLCETAFCRRKKLVSKDQAILAFTFKPSTGLADAGRGTKMLAQATGRMERGEPRPRPTEARVSDEDFLRAVRRDLASVYTDVLREPIPDRLAALLAQLEAAFQPSARTYG